MTLRPTKKISKASILKLSRRVILFYISRNKAERRRTQTLFTGDFHRNDSDALHSSPVRKESSDDEHESRRCQWTDTLGVITHQTTCESRFSVLPLPLDQNQN